MTKPVRIQRKRTKGWRMPAGAICCGRGSMWGNYAAKRKGLSGQAAVDEFRRWAAEEASDAWKGRVAIDLRGHSLACWCPLDQPCHADVLLELANQ